LLCASGAKADEGGEQNSAYGFSAALFEAWQRLSGN